MFNYSLFMFYGNKEVAKDIINYCVNNVDNLDFGDKLEIVYNPHYFHNNAFMSVKVDCFDYDKLCDFRLTAELIRGIENA